MSGRKYPAVFAALGDSQENNAYLSSHDPILVVVYDKDETIEMFGEDSLKDDGVFIPEDLLARYKKNMAELEAIQVELRKIKEAADKLW